MRERSTSPNLADALRLPPVQDFACVEDMLRERARIAADYRRRLEAGEHPAPAKLEAAIEAARRDHDVTTALIEMINPGAVVSDAQKLAVLRMLDEIGLPPHERWIPYLSLATIATYVHSCQPGRERKPRT